MAWIIAIRGQKEPDVLSGPVEVEHCVGHKVGGHCVNSTGYCPVNNCQAWLPVRRVTPKEENASVEAFMADLIKTGKVYLLEVVN